MNTINKQIQDITNHSLLRLYSNIKANQQLMDSITDKVYGPFVTFVFDEYINSSPKIMFIGQQSNGGELLLNSLNSNILYEDLITMWAKFKHNTGENSYNSPFWNFIKKINFNTNKQFSHLNFVWSNLLKIENNNSLPSEELLSYHINYYNIIGNEICACNPDIVIFLTGPNYDNILLNMLPDIKILPYHDYNPREFSQIHGVSNIKYCFRIHHPRYLRSYPKNSDRLIKIISDLTRNGT